MQQYINTVTSRGGAAIAQASVLVKTYPGGVTATIYSDDGVTETTNPLTTDANGRFSFYAADGRYQLVISKTGVIEQLTLTDILLHDPADGDDFADAADVKFTQSGSGLSATNVQDAIVEVDANLDAHIADTTAAHAASAIAF
ncbi:MAG: carboxypeptidase regulatory-like domain-containing protein, partial [Anaerolineae bacterium]|nr:carboxypeptidase regulatory-like domain-containing protein [Anaerolineae bacterium]